MILQGIKFQYFTLKTFHEAVLAKRLYQFGRWLKQILMTKSNASCRELHVGLKMNHQAFPLGRTHCLDN